ncbi:MAG TPA: phosphoribosyltransferase [Candidatus Nitrosotalea sp.]|nr:phosphoribosyltransferase [Candidatus Nitrosotalea sp.]
MAKLSTHWVGSSFLRWSDIEHDIRILTKKVRDTGFEFDKIATVSRGGLIPARLMADQFNIKTILVDKHHVPPNTLFVDDIYDSGKTFKNIISRTKTPHIFLYVTLVARKGTKYPKQLEYARKTRGNEYVIFPWEKKEQHQKSYKISNKNTPYRKPKNN